jgi:hypothetical protein
MTTGQFEYGQGGTYQAADDRRMITALAAGRAAGVVTPVALTAGAGLNVVVAAGWLAVASAADGTLGVLGSGSSITVLGNAGDAGAPRTDALWADVSPTTGLFTLSIMPQASTPGRIGIQLATITVPASANLASAFTLAPAAATFPVFTSGVTVGPNSTWTLAGGNPDPYLKIAQGAWAAGVNAPLYVHQSGRLLAADSSSGFVESWHGITTDAGWSVLGGYASVRWRLVNNGDIQFSGATQHANSASTQAINGSNPLPAIVRPLNIKVIADGNNPLARYNVEYRTDGVLYAVSNSNTPAATQAILDRIVPLKDTGF